MATTLPQSADIMHGVVAASAPPALPTGNGSTSTPAATDAEPVSRSPALPARDGAALRVTPVPVPVVPGPAMPRDTPAQQRGGQPVQRSPAPVTAAALGQAPAQKQQKPETPVPVPVVMPAPPQPQQPQPQHQQPPPQPQPQEHQYLHQQRQQQQHQHQQLQQQLQQKLHQQLMQPAQIFSEPSPPAPRASMPPLGMPAVPSTAPWLQQQPQQPQPQQQYQQHQQQHQQQQYQQPYQPQHQPQHPPPPQDLRVGSQPPQQPISTYPTYPAPQLPQPTPPLPSQQTPQGPQQPVHQAVHQHGPQPSVQPSASPAPGDVAGPRGDSVDSTRSGSRLQDNPKYRDDIARLNHAFQQSLPTAVRYAVRLNVDKCLADSSKHQAFVMNSIIQRMTPEAAKQAIQHLNFRVAELTKQEALAQITTAEIDAQMDAILSKASDKFLDKALNMRLRSIEAKPLINALARAERLGYEPGDIVEEPTTSGPERVIPHNVPPPPAPADSRAESSPSSAAPPTLALPAAAPPASAPPATAPPVAAPPAQGYQGPAPPVATPQGHAGQCMMCLRTFKIPSTFHYHIRGKLCMMQPENPNVGFPYSCVECGQGFVSLAGHSYHISVNQCGAFPSPHIAPAPAPAPVAQPPPAIPPAPAPAPAPPPPSAPAAPPAPAPSPTPRTAPQKRGRPVWTPPPATPQTPASQPGPSQLSQSSVASSSPALASGASGVQGNPYAHLSPEQLALLEGEMVRHERVYAERLKEVEQITDPATRQMKLANLKNAFKTRQSLSRKKFGVRLIGRRRKPELDAIDERVGFNRAASSSPAVGSLQGQSNMTPPASHDAKRMRVNATGSGGAATAQATAQDSHNDGEPVRRKPGQPSGLKVSPVVVLPVSPAKFEMQKANGVGDPYSSGSSSDDEDIPARLPDAVRKSLGR